MKNNEEQLTDIEKLKKIAYWIQHNTHSNFGEFALEVEKLFPLQEYPMNIYELMENDVEMCIYFIREWIRDEMKFPTSSDMLRTIIDVLNNEECFEYEIEIT